jgi:hypothetical protein
MMLHPEPVELRVAAETSHRLARIHEGLRDLGLEQCAHCQVWKDVAWFQAPPAGAPIDPLARMICTPCRDGGRP